MSPQHLSDEAVAAFADGVLAGHARDRAARHTARCGECAHAVAVQREAVWALRAAPAPALPTGLLDRLRTVPATTPINMPRPPVQGDDGRTMFASFGTMAAAAFVPPASGRRSTKSADSDRNEPGAHEHLSTDARPERSARRLWPW
jgi:anti-sigma factor RsiW